MTVPAGQDADSIILDRGGVLENRHKVHAAVVDADGRLLYAVGNPSRVTLMRSAAKPAQALAILESGCAVKYGFDEADLALMCASHNSEERHVARARGMLAKASIKEENLRCGGHPSIIESVNRTWTKNDHEPTPINNNCSGKHAGMLAAAKAVGADVLDYHLPDHPVQQRVKDVVSELTGLDNNEIPWSIDGCNLPAPAVPLSSLARIFALFASAADGQSVQTLGRERAGAMARIYAAMTRYPDMVAGSKRFCTSLMDTFQGALIGKVGADGCYGVGIRESEQTRKVGASGAVGVAVKIEDGNLDILYAAVTEIIERLQVGTDRMVSNLEPFRSTKRYNTAGVVIGQVSFPFVLWPM